MIDLVLQLYIYVTIFDIILSYIPEVKSKEWAQMVHKSTEVVQKPIRDMLPAGMPIDPAPLIVIILCQILMYLL
jgi:uncharacterized protein YggT (Ycf19 family)